MLSNLLSYTACFGWLIPFLFGLLGLLLGWLLFRGKKQVGDLSVEGEGALRAEADSLRARVQELEGRVSTRDTEVSGLKTKLAAAAVAGGAVAAVASKGDDDETYALEWRNRYLAARVKYLEGRVAEAPKKVAKKKAAPKKRSTAKKAVAGAALAGAAVAVKKKAPAKKKAAPKPKAKAAPKPKVLYKDGPTDGPKDDLKLIKGIGPKFEGDLNGKGIYYFRQIGNWKAADVTMVEGVIESIPGRIQRDEWVKQAKGLAKGAKPRAMKGAPTGKKKPGPKPGTKRGNLTATGTVRQKPGPKSGSTRTAKSKVSDKEAKFEKYFTNVKKYDPRANRDVVQNITKYCGAAMSTRDGSLVACSDESEVKRVAAGFATKKLGMTSGQLELVQGVCTQMKPDRFKNRVVFYYLAAKKAGKLSIFGG